MPSWIAVSLKTLLAIAILFLLTRLLGKRQVTQLSPFEYITGITIGSVAATIPLETDGTWHLGIVSLVVWSAVAIGIGFMQLKSKKAREWVDGKPTVLIKNGKVLDDNLKKERLTIDELMSQLRNKNIFNVADVEFAVIEHNGMINALVKNEYQPLTPKKVGLKVENGEEPHLVVEDGSILDEELARRGLNRGWLQTELEKQGVALENVFLAQVDSDGQLYLDLYDDQIQIQPPQEKAKLLATLKKCEADLEMFGLSTKDKRAKKVYEQCSNQLQRVIDEIKPQLIS
ncbi:DUF421 domain-containing protein [Laceyella putida]|uniref:DUF421 domain-containing protein n=1 Tax=Laceyella putida TaxID=110101 RepID=A0ABW2RJW5_9BACL